MDSEFLDIPNYLKDEKSGWLDRDGTFYPCEYGLHLDALVDIWDINSYNEAEKRGIVHIYWDTCMGKYEYSVDRILTDAQIKYLHENGFFINLKDLPHEYDFEEINEGLL